MTYVIDRDGKIAHCQLGFAAETAKRFDELVRKLLAVTSTAR
jgi:alkyl hydroperoxide reductase subunit AhpC